MAPILPFVILLLADPVPADAAGTLHADRIERLTGARGTLEADGTFRLVVPHTLSAPRHQARLTPGPELGSWASFTPAGDAVALSATFVLTHDQAAPSLTAALEAGLEVTAFDDPFFWDDPPLRALHVRGRGSEDAMAAAVGRVLRALRTGGGQRRAAKVAVRKADPTLMAVVGPVLGEGRLEDGLYRLAFGVSSARPAVTSGDARPGAWAAFAGVPARAMVAGDLALPAAGLQGVLRSFHAAGFEIAAVHPHPPDGGVAFVVLSYWGVGEAATLAHGLSETLKQAGVE
jgi:hypothetical protein